MDLRQIERFLSVVDSGSLSLAARQLRLSQPALSKSMRLLEEELDVTLLVRGARGVRTTAEGRIFCERARTIAAELRRAREELVSIKGGSMGRLAIGVAPGPGILNRVLSPAIRGVIEARPQLGIRVVSGTITELLRALRQEELDLVLSVLDEQSAERDLQRQILFQDRIVFVVRPEHALAGARQVTLRRLIKYRWVLSQDAFSLWRSIERAYRDHGWTLAYPPIESNSILFAITTILGSDCVGLVPSYVITEYERSTRFAVLKVNLEGAGIGAATLTRPIGLIRRRDLRPTPAAQQLMQAIRLRCRSTRQRDEGAVTERPRERAAG